MSTVEDTAVSMVCNLTGTYNHNMDKKGRINFPARLRDQLGASFWISRSLTEKCLMVHSVEGWSDLERQVRAIPGINGERARRALFSSATEVTPDQQGRILIPAALRKHAGLAPDDSVVVIGAGRKAEIWKESVWEEMEASFDLSESGVLDSICL
ncbi:MAG: division/cell wall cluster transcriptional repressor MraZ [Oscillospiraceae bacterium]|nr:division/cell wall cluster transcriptional repressor MraZ [Oscillospiraceae bacterium]